MNCTRHLTTLASLAAATLLAAAAGAETLQYRIDGTVNLTTPSAAGFPVELAGLSFGSPITLLFTFDRGATAASPSPVGGPPYDSATYYAMASARVTLLGGTAPIDLSHGTEGLWKWNDKVVFGPGPQDGLLMQNVAATGTLAYTVLTGIMSTTTWADEALPEATIGLNMQVGLARLGVSGIFFRANATSLEVSVVPEPATWSMSLAGAALLLGMAARRRRGDAGVATPPLR